MPEALVRCGVLSESSSAYASPIVIVRKKTGVDYRALNAKTPRDAYPLPSIEEALESCVEQSSSAA